MTINKCQCDGPGNCPLLRRDCDPPEGRKMSEVRHNECKNKPHYFEMFLGETEKSCKGKSKGLGDTIAKGLEKIGIKPCGGCEKRKEALNKLFPYKEK